MLADFVEVEPAWEKAAEDFLHEELEYVVVQNWDEAERGMDIMRADLDGRATFLVHPEASEQARGAGIAGRRPGRDRAAARSSAVYQRICSGASRSAATPGALFPGGRSRGGAEAGHRASGLFFLLPDGVSYHGHAVSGGKKTGGGPLALKRELRELTGEVQVQAARGGRDWRRRWSNWRRDRGAERGSGKLAELAAAPGKGRAGARS